MKAHLTRSMSNEITSIMKVNVLLEIHALVSRVTVFDEICENSYLRKSPYISLFEPKINTNHSISFKFISLSSKQSFESNSIQFGHKPQLAQLSTVISINLNQLEFILINS